MYSLAGTEAGETWKTGDRDENAARALLVRSGGQKGGRRKKPNRSIQQTTNKTARLFEKKECRDAAGTFECERHVETCRCSEEEQL